MRAVCSPPASIVYDLVTLAAMPFHNRVELKIGLPCGRLGLILWGDAFGRRIFRQGGHHIIFSKYLYHRVDVFT